MCILVHPVYLPWCYEDVDDSCERMISRMQRCLRGKSEKGADISVKKKTELTEVREVAQDFAETTLEVGTEMVLESLPELGVAVAGILEDEAISATIQTLTGGLLGGLAPAVLGVKLSYQQKRFERNMVKMIKSVVERQAIIEQRLNQLDSEVRQKFIDGPYRDVLFDHIISENQEQKVQDNINGYINLMAVENPNDDIVFSFFATLSEMNQLDIRILRLYRPVFESGNDERENIMDIMRDEGIDHSQLEFIGEKLHRLGMLDSKNEARRDENLEILGETVAELIKQLHARKPREVRAPKLKRINSYDSYSITRLGRQYLSFIDPPQ